MTCSHSLLKSSCFNISHETFFTYLKPCPPLFFYPQNGERSETPLAVTEVGCDATVPVQSVTICMVMCGRGGIMKFPACRLEGYPPVCRVIYLLCQEPGQPGLVLPHGPREQESSGAREETIEDRGDRRVCDLLAKHKAEYIVSKQIEAL